VKQRGLLLRSVRARPGLRFAKDAEHAALEIRGIRTGQCERAAIGLAVGGVVNLARPLVWAVRLHSEHDRYAQERPLLLAGVGIVFVGFWPPGRGIVRLFEPDEVAAQRAAAIDDPHLAFFVAGEPCAERIGSLRRRDSKATSENYRRKTGDCSRRAQNFHEIPRPSSPSAGTIIEAIRLAYFALGHCRARHTVASSPTKSCRKATRGGKTVGAITTGSNSLRPDRWFAHPKLHP